MRWVEGSRDSFGENQRNPLRMGFTGGLGTPVMAYTSHRKRCVQLTL